MPGTRGVRRIGATLIAVSLAACTDEAPAPYAVNAPGNRNPDGGCRACEARRDDEDGGGGSDGAAPTLAPEPRSLGLPLAGAQNVDWTVTDYVDADPKPGTIADYTGVVGELARTYDGHRGTDFAIAGFRKMDEGVEIVAVADGRVEGTDDDQFDRSTERPKDCSLRPNAVVIRHPSGWIFEYLHLRKNSVLVAEGDEVRVGDPIGLVGSSGCSSFPHVHVEIIAPDGGHVDAAARGLWGKELPYNAPLGLMDVVLHAGEITDQSQVEDAQPNAKSIQAGEILGVGTITAGGQPGDRVEIQFPLPVNSESDAGFLSNEREYDSHGVTFFYWNYLVAEPVGLRTAQILLNDEPVREVSFLVE